MQDSDTGDTGEIGDTGSLTGRSLGTYLLRSLTGIGGMAEVYRAMDLTLEREVAIKVLSAALATDEKYVRRFWTEAKQVAALNHPHIVPIYGFGEEEHGLFYHVMPLLPSSLRDRLLHDDWLAPDEAIRLTQQVASALAAAHAIGLVHRDVKPENILLDANGNALLTDFGIARDMAELKQPGSARTLARTGIPVGTPEYMAPEHLRGDSTDQRADVYALGAVLYELLVGTPPFVADTPYAIAAQVLTAPLVPPATRNGAVWPALEQVVLRALARDPGARYSDMQSFAAALDVAFHHRHGVLPWSATTLPLQPTLPPAPSSSQPLLMSTLPTRPSPGGVAHPRGGGGGRARARVALTLALALLLLAGASGSILVLLQRAGASTASGDLSGATSTSALGAPGLGLGDETPTTASTGVPTSPAPSPSPTTPVATTTPVPTATPLLTPTIVVSSNPLNFQPYPSTKPANCVAVQTLSNTSAVDAQWSCSNSAGGWQYNTAGFNSTSWQGFPSALNMTTPAHSGVYIYIKTGLDTQCKSHSTVAKITVTGGNGTSFNVSY